MAHTVAAKPGPYVFHMQHVTVCVSITLQGRLAENVHLGLCQQSFQMYRLVEQVASTCQWVGLFYKKTMLSWYYPTLGLQDQ